MRRLRLRGWRHMLAFATLLAAPAVANAQPAVKPVHNGMRGVAAGGGSWKNCDDPGTPAPKIVKINADYDPVSNTVSFARAKPAQVAKVFKAAFEGCFIEDIEPNDAPPSGIDTEHEDALSVQSTVRVRPIARVHKISSQRLKKPSMKNHGFFIADYHVKTIRDERAFRTGAPLGSISVNHSALLWLGKDGNDRLYTAVIDLQNFPAMATSTAINDLRVIKSGGWDEPPGRQTHVVPFARFKDPVGHDSKHHEGSWLGCDAGCCLATGFTIL